MNNTYSSRKIELACKKGIDNLFYQFVQKLKDLDEIKFENIFIDGTKIESNANKYTFVMKSDLILFMFKLLNKIPLEKGVFKEDKYIISYINKSLKYQYIYLNKKIYKRINKEVLLEEKYTNNGENNCFSDIIFEDIIRGLTDIEKDVIIKKYKFNYSKAEIARIKGVSRQSIHKTHMRALQKLRKNL